MIQKEMDCSKILKQIEIAVGAAKIGLDIIDSKYNIRYIDPTWKKVYGDPAGKKCYQYFMARKFVCPHCGVAEALRTKKITVKEEVLAREGNKPIQVTTVPFKDDGEWLVAETNVDITDIKRAKQSLKESEFRYRHFFDENTDAIIVADALTRRLVDCNKQALDLTGYSRQELRSMRVDQLHPKSVKSVTMESFRRMVEGTLDSAETEVLKKDGSVASVSISATPFRKDRKMYVFGIFKDISERKKAEEKVRGSEEMFRAIAERSKIGIGMSQGMTVMYVNKYFAEMFGYKIDEVVGSTFDKFVSPADRELLKSRAKKRLQRMPAPEQYEVKGVKKDGSLIDVEVDSGPAVNIGGVPTIIAVFRDVTERNRMEAKIREESELRCLTVEKMTDGLCVCHSVSEYPYVRFTIWNRQMTEITGYAMDEINKRGWYQTLYPDPDVRKRAQDRMGRMRVGDNLVSEEWEIARADGKKRILSISTTLVHTADGFAHVLAVMRDVTERRKAEAELRQTSSLLAATIESTFNGILVVDRRGMIIQYNQMFASMWGISKRVLDSHDDKKALAHVMGQLKDPSSFLKKIKDLYKRPDRESYDVLDFKDGRVFERYSRPQWLDSEIVGRVWTFHDITRRRQAEKTLQRSEARYRLLAELSQDAIYVMDLNGRFTYMNSFAAKFVGMKSEDAPGKRMDDFFPRRMVVMQKKDAAIIAKTGKPLSVTVKMGKVWMDTRLSPIIDEQGKVAAIMGVSRDITSHKQAEEVLQRDAQNLEQIVRARSAELLNAQDALSKAKRLSDVGRLSATIAHELRSPFAAIRTAAYNIKMKTKDPRLESHLANIDKKILEADQIIKNLLYYSSIKSPQRETFYFCRMMDECVELSSQIFSDHKVSIKRICGCGRKFMFEGDPIQLKAVFNNLINNAYESFGDKKGRIEIRTEVKRGYVIVRIKDNGPGIDPKDSQKLFEPFFTTKVKGMGLGLPLCNQIVSLHNGTIKVDSKLGKGTMAEVKLPLGHKVEKSQKKVL